MKKIILTIFMASFLSRIFGGEPPKSYETEEIYRSLRQQIFDLSGEQFNAGAGDRMALIMETGLQDACYTLVAAADGSASLYFSNGGGIIGAGQHPEGAAAARALLEASKTFDNQLAMTRQFPLPKPGMTRFYIIKKDSVLTGEFKEDDLGNGKLPLSPLFHKGHELIAVIRSIEEKGKGRVR